MIYSLQSIFTHIMSPIWASSLNFKPVNCQPPPLTWFPQSSAVSVPHLHSLFQEAFSDCNSPSPSSQRKLPLLSNLCAFPPCLLESIFERGTGTHSLLYSDSQQSKNRIFAEWMNLARTLNFSVRQSAGELVERNVLTWPVWVGTESLHLYQAPEGCWCC